MESTNSLSKQAATDKTCSSSTSSTKDSTDASNSHSTPPRPVAPLPDELPHIPIGHPDTMMSTESVRRAVEEFIVLPSDIIVATFPKTGTTLVTWLCHHLRTGGHGHTDFETFYEVVPWPLLSWDIGFDPNVDGSMFSPRVYKSHLRLASVYRGCRYVVTVRDPATTAESFRSFMGRKGVPGVAEMDPGTFVRDTPFVRGREGRASLWEYYAEYHVARDCPSVLILVYEDLVNDMAGAVRMLRSFMGVEPEDGDIDGLVDRVVKLGGRDVMAKYNEKFDEPYERAKRLGRVGDLTQLSPAAKVSSVPRKKPRRLGTGDDIGDGGASEFLAGEWERVMAPLGYPDYESFADMIRRKNAARFSEE